jgi:hypothetical protein
MGHRLTALVQGCTDLPLLDYVIDNLPKGLPPQVVSNGSAAYLQKPLLAAFQRKCELLGEPYLELTKHFQQEEFAQFQRERAALAREQIQALRDLSREQPEVLRQQLRDPEPALRLLAIAAVALGRHHLESDLIDRLNDQDASVRQAARRTLTRLARGTDFGPTPGASQRSIDRSVAKWRQWLALQQSTSPEKLARDAAIAAAGHQANVAPPDTAPLVLARDERPTLSPEVGKVCDELVNAKGDEQTAILARLRDAKDNDSTDALALVIPRLSGDIQQHARDALTARLTRLSAATLRDKLQDDRMEVRCAAALACGRKIAREHIADLLQLLDDPEMEVVQSARVALTELTGEDFGPTSDADRRSRTEAVAAWSKWWKERQSRQK